MARALILISKNEDDRVFAETIAKQAELTFRHASGLAEGVTIVSEEDAGAAIFVGLGSKEEYQAFEEAIQTSVGLYSPKISPNLIHFMSPSDLDSVEYLLQSPLFGNFVHTNYEGKPQEAGSHYGRVMRTSLAERAFGLDLILGSKVKVQTVALTSSEQKQDAVEAVKQFLLKAKFQNRMASLIANSVDELLLNAIYDAPVDSVGKHLFNQLPRSSVLKLEGQSQVSMEVAYDGSYAAISVIDQFGSLDKRKLLGHVSKIYVKDDYKVKATVAGVGIGLATVFQMGGSFFFVSETGVKTQVTLFFKNTANYRQFKQQFRFLSTQFYL